MIEVATVWILKALEACIMENIAGRTCKRTWLTESLDLRIFADKKKLRDGKSRHMHGRSKTKKILLKD